jgi:hypothetical protein
VNRLIVLFVIALLVIVPIASAQEAPTDNPVQDVAGVLLVLSGAAVAVNRAVEALKPLVKAFPVREAWQPYISYLVSLVVSVLTVLSIGEPANLLATNPRFASIPDVLGLLITAGVLAAGSNAVHALAGVLSGREVATVEAKTVTEYSRTIPTTNG